MEEVELHTTFPKSSLLALELRKDRLMFKTSNSLLFSFLVHLLCSFTALCVLFY